MFWILLVNGELKIEIYLSFRHNTSLVDLMKSVLHNTDLPIFAYKSYP